MSHSTGGQLKKCELLPVAKNRSHFNGYQGLLTVDISAVDANLGYFLISHRILSASIKIYFNLAIAF